MHQFLVLFDIMLLEEMIFIYGHALIRDAHTAWLKKVCRCGINERYKFFMLKIFFYLIWVFFALKFVVKFSWNDVKT